MISIPQPASETEARILSAARSVFQREGLEGARMQTIATEAGINKALLHYYFRSKDQLFERVFYESVAAFFPVIAELMRSPVPLEEKIPLFVSRYIDLLTEQPRLPAFMLHEMHHHGDRLMRMLNLPAASPLDHFIAQYREGADAGRYRKSDPRQFLMTMVASCVFPFAARPMLSMLLRVDNEGFAGLMQERKDALTRQLLILLLP